MKLDIKSLAINKKYINENYSQSGSYVHPDTPGNKHIPAGGIDGQVLKNYGLNGEAMWDDITPDNIGALSIDGDVAENTVTFDSQDSESVASWIESATMKSGEKCHQLIAKISIMSNNLRFLRKMLGSTDISKIGDGTVTGILNSLNTGLTWKYLGYNSGECRFELPAHKEIYVAVDFHSDASLRRTLLIPRIEDFETQLFWQEEDGAVNYVRIYYHGSVVGMYLTSNPAGIDNFKMSLWYR